MKYILLFTAIAFFSTSFVAEAITTMYKPFGMRVTTTTMGAITCESGTGPVSGSPAKGSIPTPYFFPSGGGGTSGTTGGSKTPPNSGNWVLGLYQSTMDFSSCHYPYPYRIPYPVYKVILYGKSK